MKREGSFLIESLVYVFCSLLVAGLLYTAIINSLHLYKNLFSKIVNNINIIKGLNDLKLDIELSDADAQLWNISHDKISFISNTNHIEWFIEKETLFRCEWNFKKKKMKNPVAKNVKTLSCNLFKSVNDTISKGLIKIVSGNKEYQFTANLINGYYEVK
jgi:hypothetical protein